ncbi:MAG: hypothetical protein ACYCO0_04415 [Candidatus Micrarchaeaceae archaeon]
MKTILTPKICYMAGIYSKGPKKEKNFVSLNTDMEYMQQHFAEIAVNELHIEPSKIIIARDSRMSVGFYHSRVAKQLQNISSRETYLFKKTNELAKSYIAGIFDASGHFVPDSIEIKHITPSDALMLENFGIHSKGDKILNISKFIALIEGFSLLLSHTRLHK